MDDYDDSYDNEDNGDEAGQRYLVAVCCNISDQRGRDFTHCSGTPMEVEVDESNRVRYWIVCDGSRTLLLFAIYCDEIERVVVGCGWLWRVAGVGLWLYGRYVVCMRACVSR